MHLNCLLMILLCLAAAALARPQYGPPPQPSGPISIDTLIGPRLLYRNQHFPLTPSRPYRDQARFIPQHGYHAEYLVEALGRGAYHPTRR